MKQRQRQVGFSQRVRLEWLERTASLVLAGNTEQETLTGSNLQLAWHFKAGGW